MKAKILNLDIKNNLVSVIVWQSVPDEMKQETGCLRVLRWRHEPEEINLYFDINNIHIIKILETCEFVNIYYKTYGRGKNKYNCLVEVRAWTDYYEKEFIEGTI